MDVPDRRQTFGVVDYCVFGGTLLMSLMIGVFYAFRGKHTNEEMLLGNRQLRVLPVAISVMVSFLSAIMILGKRILASALTIVRARIVDYNLILLVSLQLSHLRQ